MGEKRRGSTKVAGSKGKVGTARPQMKKRNGSRGRGGRGEGNGGIHKRRERERNLMRYRAHARARNVGPLGSHLKNARKRLSETLRRKEEKEKQGRESQSKNRERGRDGRISGESLLRRSAGAHQHRVKEGAERACS